MEENSDWAILRQQLLGTRDELRKVLARRPVEDSEEDNCPESKAPGICIQRDQINGDFAVDVQMTSFSSISSEPSNQEQTEAQPHPSQPGETLSLEFSRNQIEGGNISLRVNRLATPRERSSPRGIKIDPSLQSIEEEDFTFAPANQSGPFI